MRSRDLFPPFLAEYVRIATLRLRHPSCSIHSQWIAKTARIGRHCAIAHGVEIGGYAQIGDYSYVNAGSIVVNARIGSFCSIGYNCCIGPHEHPTHALSTSPRVYGDRGAMGLTGAWQECRAPSVIGSDVWIGANAIVLQGVEIGVGAIVGAGSVVTKDVAAYAVVLGAPARFLRFRLPPETRAALLKLKWWELPIGDLKKCATSFRPGEMVSESQWADLFALRTRKDSGETSA